jgi:hypothetical protein
MFTVTSGLDSRVVEDVDYNSDLSTDLWLGFTEPAFTSEDYGKKLEAGL